MEEQSINLYYCEGSSDKEYHAQVVEVAGGYNVTFQYGRRGSTLQTGTKNSVPLSLDEATKVYDKLVKSKLAKGYAPDETQTPTSYTSISQSKAERATGTYPQLLNVVEESELPALFKNKDICAQEKHDGKRMMLQYDNEEATAINRTGLVCGAPAHLLAETERLGKLHNDAKLLLDGESVGDDFYAFDILFFKGVDVTDLPQHERERYLRECLYGSSVINIVHSEITDMAKASLFMELQNNNKEGIVFKDRNAKYVPGRPNSGGTQLKFKFLAEATCRVASIHKSKRSFSVEVADGAGGHIGVGNITLYPNQEFPEVGQFVEIRYMNILRGGSLYQPVFKMVRDDKTEADLYDTLKFKN